ncbi:MAG: alpha/beta hydrolase [Thermodesulfobacteriota bacterium]
MQKSTQDTTIFIHGQESSSKGTKGLFFKEHFPEMIVPDFTGTLEDRMSKLNEILAGKTDIIMVGSSLGGLMGALYAFQNKDRMKKLILLAPALNLPEFNPYREQSLSVPVYVFHGKNDELIPAQQIEEIVKAVFPTGRFTLLDDDHRLTKKFTSINWPQLLERSAYSSNSMFQ